MLASRHRRVRHTFREILHGQVITVEREYGSQGAEFAHRLADRLHWKLIDRCLIDEMPSGQAFRKAWRNNAMNVSTRYYRMGKSFWHGSVDHLPAPQGSGF